MTTMDDRVERVAGAIATARYRHDYGVELDKCDVPALAARCWNEACAAIEADDSALAEKSERLREIEAAARGLADTHFGRIDPRIDQRPARDRFFAALEDKPHE